MRKTTVTFLLRIMASETEQSAPLEEVMEAWRVTIGVSNIAIEWKSNITPVPNKTTTAYVEAKIEIEANTSKGLQSLFNKLTRVADKESGRLASRSCILNELYD